MVYNHDFSFSVVLKSGKVLLGGGCAEPLGIGQTFPTEMYDPKRIPSKVSAVWTKREQQSLP